LADHQQDSHGSDAELLSIELITAIPAAPAHLVEKSVGSAT
jgi:hypothetical protein